MKTVERAIYEKLKTFASGRVYAMRAVQNATAPFVVFQRTSSDRWRSVNAPSGIAQARIQVDVYAETYYEAKDMAASIEAVLDGLRDQVNYGDNSPQDFLKIAGISLETDVDLFDQTEEPFLYRNSATYLLKYEQ